MSAAPVSRAPHVPKPHGCGWCGQPVIMPHDGEHAFTARNLDGTAHHCVQSRTSVINPPLFELEVAV